MKTPRTDAERRSLKKSKSYPVDPVSAEFARQLEDELNQWKANHDNQVKLKSLLINRPDLGDRAPRIQKMLDENKHLKDELAAMTALADRLAKTLRKVSNCRIYYEGSMDIDNYTTDEVKEALSTYENHKKPDQQIKQPCDCIEKCGKYWIQRCDCQNDTSLAEAQSWCDHENHKKGNTP